MIDFTQFFKHAAELAARQTLPRFRQNGAVDNKLAKGFDPVTQADREAESALRAEIMRVFPDHGILGEEFGAYNSEADNIWVIDPIDGTRSYICGMATWGTLCGLVKNGKAIAGFMSQPYLGELFCFDEVNGARLFGPMGEQVLKTANTTSLNDATLFTTDPDLFDGQTRHGFERLKNAARLTRYSADCYAFAMVALGSADLVYEVGLNSYDIAALVPIVEGAGGVITQVNGERAENGGDILAAATPQLHKAALDLIFARG